MKSKILYPFVSMFLIGALIVLILNGFSYRSIIRQLYASGIEKTKIYSSSLQKNQNIAIYIPPGYTPNKRYPVLYLLHGKDGNENSWFNGIFGIGAAHIDQTANRLIKKGSIRPMIIVCPQIDNSYGVNTATTTRHVNGHDEGLYENFLIQELIPFIDSNYSTVQSKEGRFIGGISMGGFASLHLAFAHPDLFSKAGAHSAALRLDTTAGSGIGWLFQNGNSREQTDPLFQADTLKKTGVSVYIDHGEQDHQWLIEGSKILYLKLADQKVDVKYHTAHGGHDYRYWSSQTEKYLQFYGG